MQTVALFVRLDRDPDHLLCALGAQPDQRRLGEVGLDVRVSRPARAGQLDQQLGRVDGRLLGELGRHTLFPARLRLGAHVQPLAASEHAELFEVRGLQQHRVRVGGDFALLSAHDPRDRDRPF